jgi:glycerol uptake facilitator protein
MIVIALLLIIVPVAVLRQPGPFVGEFLGTMTLILLGDGVVAGVLLNKSKAQNGGWIVITTAWAFAVMCGVFVSIAAGGTGSLNPAVTIAVMLRGGMSINTGIVYIVAELLGAFTGAILVWLHYLPHWGETEDPGLKLAVFSTGPAIRNPVANLISEIIGTFVLLFVVFSITGNLAPGKAAATNLVPVLVAGLIWAIGLGLGGTTGYAINPARDLGPRIAHALLPIPGKGESDWGYAWIPVVGPIIGAVLATILVMSIKGM